MKNILPLILLLAAAPVFGGEAVKYESAAAGDWGFDAVFQDYVETASGYKSSRAVRRELADLRDAVISSTAPSAAQPAAPAKLYVTVTAKPDAGARFITELASTRGFTLSGERTTYLSEGRKTVYLGWAAPEALSALCAKPGVAGVQSGSGAAARSACAAN